MSRRDAEIRVGAVAYHPRIVTIWETFLEHFERQGVGIDYILYSNYERLIDAALAGDVDIAWNTNTAFVALEQRLGGEARILGMRDVDAEFATVIVTRRGETFDNDYYEMVRPCAPHRYSPPRRSAAWGSRSRRPAAGPNRSTGRPPHRGDRFPSSTPEPGPSDHARATIHAGHPSGQSAGSRQTRPEATTRPRFRMSSIRFRHFIGGSLSLAFVIHT